MDRLFRCRRKSKKMKRNQNSTRPELNIEYVSDNDQFDGSDVYKIFDKIYELKFNTDISSEEKFNELLDWISDGNLIYKYSR